MGILDWYPSQHFDHYSALGIGNMTELYRWLLNLNSVVMPLRYLWVFLALC